MTARLNAIISFQFTNCRLTASMKSKTFKRFAGLVTSRNLLKILQKERAHTLFGFLSQSKVILVTGAPGEGKSRWATKNMLEQDVLIDLDLCFQKTSGEHGHDLTPEQFHKYFVAAMRLRNARDKFVCA